MHRYLKQALTAAGIVCLLGSCVDFLDRVPDSVSYNDEEVFTDYTRSLEFINQLMIPYRYFDDNDMNNGNVGSRQGTHGKSVYGLRDRITDLCIANQQYSWHPLNTYRSGEFYDYHSDGYFFMEGEKNRYATIWKAIRVANLSIANVGRIVDATDDQRAKILGMAYFLRGHFYFMMLQGWGGMPYITESLDPEQNMDLPRLSYAETAQRIAQDFETAAGYLPLVVEDSEWGRPSKMAAVAYRAKALVWAASPYSNPANDTRLWADAATACAEAIQMAEGSGYYGLVDLNNFKKLFVDCDSETLREVLFGRAFNNSKFGWAPYFAGIKSNEFGNGQMGAESVTENLAQSFPWSNGEPVNPDTDEYRHHPYTGDGVNHTGRDPRFYQTILYNGAVTPQVSATGRKVQIWNKSYDNAVAKELQVNESGNAVNGYTFTGYYNWKLFSNAYVNRGVTNVMWNYIRLADVYLYYAESANRAWGPTGAPEGVAGFTMTAVEAINKVRARAGMPAYDQGSPDSWLRPGSTDEFEQKIRNEIKIETAFEEKRFYDLRRWHMMTDPDLHQMYGMYIEQTSAGNFTYTVVPLASHLNLNWQEHHHLFKIMVEDTNLGPNFEQNPGW